MKIKKQKDWRRQGQENYLKNMNLEFKVYQPHSKEWDHDHCEFCGIKFSKNEDGLNNGYTTKDGYWWVCVNCFNDFKSEFNWTL